MREIKFRAWDDNARRMFFGGKDFSTIPVINQPIGLKSGGMISCKNMMQYTGLKDDDLVEIFEGDILQTWRDYVKQDNPDIVEDLGWMFTQLAESDPYYKITRCKVIGNIYENPELMEQGP